MSDSAPSDSSTDVASSDSAAGFLASVGVDLVEITRTETPIFLAPELRWGAAGHEEGLYGAPLDRLFGEEANAYVTGAVDPEEIVVAAIAAGPRAEDPMVSLPGLADGLILMMPDEAPLQVGALDENGHVHISADTLHTAEVFTVFDFGPDAHASATHMHEAWTWDLDKGSWVFDHHA